MKKLLFSVSMAALALCLTIPLAHAMKRELEDEKPSSLQKTYLPAELWDKIIFHTLEMHPKALNILLIVDKNLNKRTKLLPVDLDPWANKLTDEIMKQFPNFTWLNLQDNVMITDEGIKPLKYLNNKEDLNNKIAG